MVVFGVKAERLGVAQSFMDDTHKRLQNQSMVKNPFTGRITRLKGFNGLDHYLIDMTPMWPPFYLGGVLVLMLCLVFFKIWLLIGGLVILSFGLFWSRYFLYIMLRLGLRNVGYKGKVALIKDNDMLKHLMYKVL